MHVFMARYIIHMDTFVDKYACRNMWVHSAAFIYWCTAVTLSFTFKQTTCVVLKNHSNFESLWYKNLFSVCQKMTSCQTFVCVSRPHPEKSFPQSLQVARRPAGPSQRSAHRGWANWGHNITSCGALWLWMSHRGKAPYSSHSKAHCALLAHLREEHTHTGQVDFCALMCKRENHLTNYCI